jgi:hypothetical protein
MGVQPGGRAEHQVRSISLSLIAIGDLVAQRDKASQNEKATGVAFLLSV